MILDDVLRDLVREQGDTLLPLLRKVYEFGYREGLAVHPESPLPLPPATVIPIPALAADPSPPAAPGRLFDPPVDAEGEADLEADEVEPEDEAGPRPVRASITAGGLYRKIVRHFGLERFDIEVVICRPGDPARRRLKDRVRLSHFLLDGD